MVLHPVLVVAQEAEVLEVEVEAEVITVLVLAVLPEHQVLEEPVVIVIQLVGLVGLELLDLPDLLLPHLLLPPVDYYWDLVEVVVQLETVVGVVLME